MTSPRQQPATVPDRYVVARGADEPPMWEVWDTRTDRCLDEFGDVADARACRDELEAEHRAAPSAGGREVARAR